MVDTSSLAGVLRASNQRRRRPTGEPPNQTRTQREERKPSLNTDQLFSGYMRNQLAGADVKERGLGSSFVESGVQRGAIPDSAATRGAGVVGDLATDPMNFVPGLGLAFGSARAARSMQNVAPLFERGARGASPQALETTEAINARRNALMRLLNEEGPYAVNEYLKYPKTGYSDYINKGILKRFFEETSERIPKGYELYRAPSKGEVLDRLPRTKGAEYRPGVVKSTGGSADLNRLGEVSNPKKMSDITGGNQQYAPGFAKIYVREDLPGILDITDYLARYPSLKNSPRGGLGESSFNLESLLGPQTRYTVNDFYPATGDAPPYWILNAYRG